ncbi:hypothetical protein H6784_04945 [Candidatus Nomurabacteria bacterium]|nr:hypothetical protein [Candidatus Nomurabacteria bacterium]
MEDIYGKKINLHKLVLGQIAGISWIGILMFLLYDWFNNPSRWFPCLIVWGLSLGTVYLLAFYFRQKFMRGDPVWLERQTAERQALIKALVSENMFWQYMTPGLGVYWLYHPPKFYTDLEMRVWQQYGLSKF